MRVSQFPLFTVKEVPADAAIVSHRLMLRAGLIRKVAAGIYNWLPLGLRVMHNVAAVVREEMNRIGALELLMPGVQPAELWRRSGRWTQYGPELLRLQDRHHNAFCLGPTHEEVITELASQVIRSYKQLPITFYQIQTKFRDEVRPRFGVMRAREFVMKDAYSFHLTDESLDAAYQAMHGAYTRIFQRLGLTFRAVMADAGAIGGDGGSQEFHVLADSGEDAIVFSTDSDYAANIETAQALPPAGARPAPTEPLRTVDTPNAKTIAALVEQFDLPIAKTVKTLIVKAAQGEAGPLVALMVRGDHELNAIKAAKLTPVASPLTMATADEIREVVGAGPGSLGPINLPMPIIIDHAVAHCADFGAGANEDGKHHFGINWERDAPLPTVADIRNVLPGDPSPDGRGVLEIARGIEVGHIFKLGAKYAEALGAGVLDEHGQHVAMPMGCYGIGITRIVAAAIEQHHDDAGIRWPLPMAPFQVALVPINAHKSQRLQAAVMQLYRQLLAAGIDVLWDDRPARPGVMFADMELIGIPYRVVFSERGLDADTVELRSRDAVASEVLPRDDIVAQLTQQLGIEGRR